MAEPEGTRDQTSVVGNHNPALPTTSPHLTYHHGSSEPVEPCPGPGSGCTLRNFSLQHGVLTVSVYVTHIFGILIGK